MQIERVSAPDEKSEICERILKSLPEWFGVPASVERYIHDVRETPFFTVRADGVVAGFAALKEHNEHTAEILVVGVLPEYHRRGVGRTLISAAELFCRDTGRSFLTVKTLDESDRYEPYLKTLAFYRAMGFLPLQVIDGYWDEQNPCLMLAKWLGTQHI